MTRVVLVSLTCFFASLISPDSHGLNCDDLKVIDASEKMGDSLLHMTGCLPTSSEILQAKLDKFPEEMRTWARYSYLIDGQRYPNKNEYEEILRSIGTGQTLAQKILAGYMSLESPAFHSVWSEIAQRGPTSEFERRFFALTTWARDLFDEPWSMSRLEVSRLLEDSQIPSFKMSYAQLMYEDFSGVEYVDAAIKLLNEHADHPWSSYYKAMIYEDLDSIEHPDRDLNLRENLRAAAEYGLVYALFDLANKLNIGEAFEMDEAESVKIFRQLAKYGHPSSQAQLGNNLLWGYGVEQNEELGTQWIELGAKNGSIWGSYRLFEQAIGKGDFQESLRLSAEISDGGYVNFESHGYMTFLALLPHARLPKVQEERLRDFAFKHCENNILVGDKSECKALGYTDAEFSVYPSLVDALSDPSIIRLANEIDLDTGKYVALIVANDDYAYWDPLSTPRSDAMMIGETLKEKYGFEVQFLFNGSRRETLSAIYQASENLSFEDHFLLYYGGHGVVDADTDTAYWIPSDAPRNFRPDWISTDEVMTSLKSIPTRHLLLVADSCYSGNLLRGSAPTRVEAGSATIKRLFDKKARVAITSGGDEPVVDSVGSSGNSIFAEAFNDALNSSDGPIPASQIFEVLLGEVSLEASQTPRYADMRELGHDGGDFIFVPGAGQ